MSVAAWVCRLPDVHPFLVDMAQTLDRTVVRLQRRLGSLQAEVARLEAELGAAYSQDPRLRLAAYREERADYKETLLHCRTQFEAQMARRWAAAEISRAKGLASGTSKELGQTT